MVDYDVPISEHLRRSFGAPMALTAGAIYAASAAAAVGILAATREEAILGGPEYIRDAEPEGISRRIGLALARQTCRRYADGNVDITPARAAQYENACRPYLDFVGYGTGPSLIKPFEGGQCPVQYTATWERRGTVGSTGVFDWQPRSFTGNLLGPVSVRNEATNPLCTLPELTNQSWVLVRSGGVGATILASGCADVVPSYRNLVLTRVDGQSDVCGGPPPTFTDPEPPGTPGPTIEPVIIIPIVNIDAGVEINLDGTVDITIDGVEFNIDPFGDDDGGPGGGGVGPDDLVPDGGLAGSPADTGDGGLAEGEAPPGQELVGVRVEVLESPIGANQYSNNAAVVYRGIGYVRMGYSGRLALDVGASAVISPQFFIAPVRGLTNWEHRANNGFINRVTPFYRELPI